MQRKLTIAVSMAALLAAIVVLPVMTGCGPKKDDAAKTETPAETPSDVVSTTGLPAGDAAKGQEIFTTNCVLCHGTTGTGDGPGGAALNPKPRNFRDTAYMSTKTDEELFNSIKHGKSGVMPAWGDAGMSDQDIANALAYVRSLAK